MKRALVHSESSRSKEREHLRSIYVSTFGILFFSTPHDGAGRSFLLASQNIPAKRINQKLLEALLKDSSFLAEIADSFASLRKQFQVCNFSEEIPTAIGPLAAMVVSPHSARPSWDEAQGCGISATHSGMVKYVNRASPGCKVALAALERFQEQARSIIRTRWDDEHQLRFEEHERRLLQELQSHLQGNPQEPKIYGATECQEYHVPRLSSNYFVGRQWQIQRARERFGPAEYKPMWHKPKVLVVCGLGGSGKTQFALKFAEDSRDKYWGIFWVDATTVETLKTSFTSIGMSAGKGSLVSSAIFWLSSCSKPWLLIFDNADDPEMNLSEYFPPGGNGHIMITTRNPGANVFATQGCIKLSGMDPEEAIALLLRRAFEESDAQGHDPAKRSIASIIAKKLGYLAIALNHAGAAIRNRIYTLEAYLHHYFGHRRVIRGSIEGTHSALYTDIIATWEIPFQKIARKSSTEHRDAVDLVHMFAFLHFESIPEQIFRRSWHNLILDKAAGADSYPDFLRMDGPCDEEARTRFRRAVRVLYEYSLIDHDPDSETCSLHPVVHRWAQDRLATETQLQWLNCVTTVLAYCISSHLEASGRRFRQSLLPHIDACFREHEERNSVLPDTLSRAAEIERFASVYAENGRWDKAKEWQQRVLNFRRKKLGRWHDDTIQAQRNLSEIKWNLFEFESAGLMQKEILLLRWFARPSLRYWVSWPPWKPDHTEYCLALDDLSRTLWLAGDRVYSRYVGERAVRGLTKRLGPDDPRTLNAMFNLARTYLHLEDQQLSHRLLVKVLVGRKRLFGMDHPDTLLTRNELGINLCAQKAENEQVRQRQLAMAETLVRNVHEARKRILGEEHAYTLWSANDLSKVLCERKRGAEAVAELKSILGVVERTLGEKHVGMTMTKSNLARAYVLCEQWEAAEKELRDLITNIPPDHIDTINARSGLVHVLIRMGKLAEAEADCGSLLAMIKDARFKKILLPDSPRVLKIYEQMLEIYHLQNRTEELRVLSLAVPAAKVPLAKERFEMLPVQRVLRTESELDRLE